MASLRDYLEAKDVLDQKSGSSQTSQAEQALPTQQRGLDLLLTTGQFPAPLSTLFEQSGVELSEFTESLETLKAAGLVKVSKTDGDTTVELTERGQALRAE